MNRRGFLRFLAAIPIIRNIPLVDSDGGLRLSRNMTVSPAEWASRLKKCGGGGGGGSGGGIAILIVGKTALTVRADGGKNLDQ